MPQPYGQAMPDWIREHPLAAQEWMSKRPVTALPDGMNQAVMGVLGSPAQDPGADSGFMSYEDFRRQQPPQAGSTSYRVNARPPLDPWNYLRAYGSQGLIGGMSPARGRGQTISSRTLPSSGRGGGDSGLGDYLKFTQAQAIQGEEQRQQKDAAFRESPEGREQAMVAAQIKAILDANGTVPDSLWRKGAGVTIPLSEQAEGLYAEIMGPEAPPLDIGATGAEMVREVQAANRSPKAEQLPAWQRLLQQMPRETAPGTLRTQLTGRHRETVISREVASLMRRISGMSFTKAVQIATENERARYAREVKRVTAAPKAATGRERQRRERMRIQDF